MKLNRLITLFVGALVLAGCGLQDQLNPAELKRVTAEQARSLRNDARVQALIQFDSNYQATLYSSYHAGPNKGKAFVSFRQCGNCDGYSYQANTQENARPDFWFEIEPLSSADDFFTLKSSNPSVRFWVPPNPQNSTFCTYDDPNFLSPDGLKKTQKIATALAERRWADAEIDGHIWKCKHFA
ncbi:MAG TPA: hypothetical protein VFT87_03340 [Candidatus Saccharimonadales bacterium]|nr:hypothetical protein [Candidatus Saccharimonadales bacterium]